MRIQHNIAALNAHRQLGVNNAGSSKALEKLSSGFRINRAADDAAGLAISEKMRGQIRGLTQATRNAQDGISLIQTAEGGLQESHAILQRMRELAVQSSTGTYTETDRQELQAEVNQLVEELSRIADTTEFNTKKLLDGGFKESFHIGANTGQAIGVTIEAMSAEKLGVAEGGKTFITATQVTEEDGLETTTITEVAADEVMLGPGVYTAAEENVSINEDGIAVLDAEGTKANVLLDAGGNLAAVWVKEDGYYGVGDVELSGDSIQKTSEAGDPVLPGVTVPPDGGEDPTTTHLANDNTVTVGGISILTDDDANGSISIIDAALSKVSTARSKLGAVQNRLEHTVANLGVTTENLTDAESRIRDVDMAAEMMEFTKFNILNQASIAMLAQANMQPQSVLQLLA